VPSRAEIVTFDDSSHPALNEVNLDVHLALLILAGVLAIGIVPPLLMDRLRRPGWEAT